MVFFAIRLLLAELSCGIILKEYWGKSEDVTQKEKTFIFGAILPEEIDKDDGKDHEDGDDEEEDLAPLLSLALEDNGIETALFEERGTVLVVMVVVMVMLLFRHKM